MYVYIFIYIHVHNLYMCICIYVLFARRFSCIYVLFARRFSWSLSTHPGPFYRFFFREPWITIHFVFPVFVFSPLCAVLAEELVRQASSARGPSAPAMQSNLLLEKIQRERLATMASLRGTGEGGGGGGGKSPVEEDLLGLATLSVFVWFCDDFDR